MIANKLSSQERTNQLILVQLFIEHSIEQLTAWTSQGLSIISELQVRRIIT